MAKNGNRANAASRKSPRNNEAAGAAAQNTGQKKNKNNSVEFFRFLFTVVILIHHAGSFPGGETLLRRGYLCVEFFFILSGFYLYRSFQAEREHSTLTYLKKRLVRLYPEYLFAAVVCIGVLGVLNHEFDLSKAVNELLMLQNTGIFHLGGYNFPCWYLSVMMVAGLLIYSFLSVREKDFLHIIAPVLVIGTYTFLSGAENGVETWGYLGPLSFPLLRGLADMSAGVLLSAAVMEKVTLSQGASLLLEGISLILIGLGMFTDFSGEMLTIFAFMALILSLTACENSVSRAMGRSRLIPIIGEYSYTLYLNHGILVKVFQILGKKTVIPFAVPVYLGLLIVYSIITKKIVTAVTSAVLRKKPD